MEIQSIEFEATQRVKRLREAVFSARPKVCAERAAIVTEVYRATDDLPPLLRRARCLMEVLSRITCPIFPDELIVGQYGSKRRSCPVFPEMSTRWLEEELDTLTTRDYDRFELDDETREKLLAIFPYWHGRTLSERLFAQMPEETRRVRMEAGVFSVSAHEDTGLGHVIMHHEKILKRGLRDIIREVEEKRAALDLSDTQDMERDLFYRAAVICLKAVIVWAHRYAETAKRQAEAEADPARREELMGIYETCMRVPEYPARSFQEALQCVWFIQLAAQIETDGAAVTVGRLDQFAYPYLKADLDAGADKAKMQEVLDCFWLKFAEMVKLYKLATARILAGFPMGENIIIGGIDANGCESVNALSYMCLDAHRHCRLYEPNFSVRISSTTSERFLRCVCENLRMGTGHPVIFNEDIGIQTLVAHGIPLKEARNYAPIGCVENSVVDMWMRANGGYISLGKLVELAIHDGKCQMTGRQVGPHTGLLEEHHSFEDFQRAYREQAAYFIHHNVIENNLIDVVNREIMPIPLVSILYDSCVESGRDVTAGGARYNFTCPGLVGVANAADSMEAIRKFVYEDRLIDPAELRRALSRNFEGCETLRLRLINDAPKYGNDVLEVDLLARFAVDVCLDELEKYENARGGRFTAGLTAITANIGFGALAGATPDGRLAGTPLAEGCSPSAGRDCHGPTASMESVARVDHVRLMKGLIYNQKFAANALDKRDDLGKFVQMLRGYCDIHGAQVQFNVVSRQTLLDAQKHPENYRDLVVRVAGYSAFYTELSAEVQQQIILRTEYQGV